MALITGPRRKVVEVAGGGGNTAVAELAGDDGDVDTLDTELSGVGVAESVGLDALVDAGPGAQTFEHDPAVTVAIRSLGACRRQMGPARAEV